MHFITTGFKRYSWTNSTDPRQRVPLTARPRQTIHASVFCSDFSESWQRLGSTFHHEAPMSELLDRGCEGSG